MSSRSLKTHLLEPLSALNLEKTEVSVFFVARDNCDNTYHVVKYVCVPPQHLRPEDIPDFACSWRRVQWQQWDPNETITDCTAVTLDAAIMGAARQLVERTRQNGPSHAIFYDSLIEVRYDSGSIYFPDDADLSVAQFFSDLLWDFLKNLQRYRRESDESWQKEARTSMATQLGNTTPLASSKEG